MADTTSRRAFLAAGATAAVGVALAAVVGATEQPAPKVAGRIPAGRRDEPVPVEDPDDDAWSDATPILVPLVAQQLVPPTLDEAGVSELRVEALHDGETLGFRLSWDDGVVDEIDGFATFRDAVAVQLPHQPGPQPPPITMGAPGAAVHLLQWRATWERDLGRRVSVQDVYPNAVADVPPDAILPPETAVLYYPGRAVGNPLSALVHTTTVEELVAEGFGSATVLEQQSARGKGVHREGRWQVALGFPLARGASGAPIAPGSVWPVAFAVWLGSRQNRGSRKQYADWLEVEVEA